MTRPSWLGPLLASVLAHGALGWRLYAAPVEPSEAPAREPFVVRTVEVAPQPLPPPVPPSEPPRSRPLEPPVPKAAPAVPKPMRPAPKLEPAAAPSELTPSEPLTAPAALLAAGPSGAGGGVVQLPGAALGAWAPSTLAPAPDERAPAARRPSAFTKLSDLSRKPRAPILDAALRDNYPPEQRRRGVEGQAEVQVVIEGDGRVGEISVLSESSASFAEACRRTLRGSRWSEPLGPDGQPVRTRLTYRCRFRIER